jgi:late competence protein required for DNA uptake (superfamily II DNA/RNA helicase)
MQLSKEISLDCSIPYETLKEVLEEDSKIQKIQTYYRNCLAIRRMDDKRYHLIYPNQKKNEVNIDEVIIENGILVKTEQKASGLKASPQKI